MRDRDAAEAIESLERALAAMTQQMGSLAQQQCEPTLGLAPLAGISILVLEDDSTMRDGLTALLTQLAARVHAVATVEEAFARFSAEPPDVILSDMKMSGPEQGFELVRRVRALPPARGGTVPAIALTAAGTPEDYEHSREAGFQRHLVKPPRLDELIAAILSLTRPQP
jgi:CheY-like chemotaxis protein